ncbi:MAG: transcription termination/antitermination protein NusA [Actinomycetota bacterium]
MKIDMSQLRSITQSLDMPLESVIPPIEEALMIAYLRLKGAISDTPKPGEFISYYVDGKRVRVVLDLELGTVSVLLTEKDAEGNYLGEVDDTPDGFDRIATQTTRKVLTDKFRKVTDAAQTLELENQIGTMVNGVIQQGSDPKMVFVDLGKIEAQMPPAEQVPTEKYVHGSRLRVILVAVRQLANGMVVVVSRTHPALVKQMFALEVPEVADGTVEIVAVAREAGARTKIAVLSHNPQVAAKGSCIGPMGARVNAVVNELNGEKIDIVDYSDDPAKFLAAALAPARVARVEITDLEARHARVFVPDFQLSLAIGKEGQNARLAARLTGWKIDIRSDADPLYSQSAQMPANEG